MGPAMTERFCWQRKSSWRILESKQKSRSFNSLREPLLSVTLTHMVLGIDLIATASFN
jgi:hypothetical protein